MKDRLRALKKRQSVIDSYQRAHLVEDPADVANTFKIFEEQMKSDVAALQARWKRQRSGQSKRSGHMTP